MLKSRVFHLVVSLLLAVSLLVSFGAFAVSAADTTTPTPAPAANLTLKCNVPTYADNSGSTFSYSVDMKYDGNDTIMVVLSTINPPGWTSTISYTSKEVTSLPIGPQQYNSPDLKTLTVSLTPNSGTYPDPGDYKMTLKAASGDFNLSLDLTATVKARYGMTITTPDGKLNSTALAGKDNQFTFQIQNTGSAALENTTFTTDAPSGWTIKFSPESAAKLEAGQIQSVIATITPPGGQTVAGDYNIVFYANNSHTAQSMNIRLTVNASSIWGVVSIIIIVVVIIGLAVLFLRLGRR